MVSLSDIMHMNQQGGGRGHGGRAGMEDVGGAGARNQLLIAESVAAGLCSRSQAALDICE